MTHRYDGSSLDLEKRLVYYMVRNRVSRRTLLERMAKYGSAVALAPVVAACAGSAASPSARPSVAAPSTAPQSVAPSQSAAPTPVPSPEAELNVYNWLDYIGEGVIESFEEKYGVKVNYDLFDDIYAAYEVLGDDGAGYDVSFPIGVDLPDFIARGVVRPLDHSLIPNLVNLGAEWADPGYDPGNAHSMPYVWWTTGIGYDTTKITEAPTSSNALWDPRWSGHISMMDDYQETFGLTLIQQGHSANTTNTTELDQALARLQEQKPLVRTYTNDTVTTMAAGDVWIGMIWGSDVYQISLEREDENVAYYIPEEGGVRGSDTMAIYSGAQHPIAAHLFINHMLDAEVSAANTNYIGYMGPNAAAMEFISPDILADPAVNPAEAVLENLEELLDLPNAVDDEYLSRWETLRAS
ncbi:MAG TPA: spermidine/putrescine ABC transporter substrate-binding protein [Candidatus Limnocylindrales bacterium]|nr:spermidine/putrescine ABC transporter substrate-binding protein [Candidatus Limnocylindrales bacterium]